jgi:hypothetical protein
MMLELLVSAALAAGPETYALRADVPLPASGASRVTLGPDLVGADPDHLAQSLRLEDAQQAAVPYAVLLSTAPGDAIEHSLSFAPTDRLRWETEAAEEPVDSLRFDFIGLSVEGPFLVRVESRDGGDWRPAGAGIVYEIDDDFRNTTVDVAHRRGPFRVSVATLGSGDAHLTDLDGLTRAATEVPAARETFDLPAPLLTEQGTARYVVPLAGPRVVTAVTFDVTDPLFDREVSLGTPSDTGGEPSLSSAGRIRRVAIGDTHVDRVRVLAPGRIADDTLVIDVATDRGRALAIPHVTVESVGAELVVRDAGPGPHVLYAGGTELEDAFDLATAVPAILRLDPPTIAASVAAPNPNFVPVATRAGVDEAGAELNLTRFHWSRPITGGPGWARMQLEPGVLAHARSDLADLRVIDGEGHQIPFLLRNTGREEPFPTQPFTREEAGNTSRIRVPLPDGGVPLATVRLTSPGSVFERQVSILRDRGAMTETLREVTWNAPVEGQTLSIGVGEPVGNALLVQIANGDNPPLKVDTVTVTTPVWEIRANLPPSGARLIYGAPGQEAPTYDLSLLRDTVFRAPAVAATLGPEEKLGVAGPSGTDKAIVLVGIGILALGLVGMTARVLIRVEPATP